MGGGVLEQNVGASWKIRKRYAIEEHELEITLKLQQSCFQVFEGFQARSERTWLASQATTYSKV
jgi:hypothetical protein